MEENKIKLKQFVIVPKQPKMSKGKIASQVAHAIYMAIKNHRNKPAAGADNIIIDEWEKSGMCVIVLKARDTNHLNDIAKYLEQWNIPHHLYIDEGLFGCDPFTPTALATGVLDETQHWYFEKMELFK